MGRYLIEHPGTTFAIALVSLAVILGSLAVVALRGEDTRSDSGNENARQDADLTRTLCAQADVVATAFRNPAPGESVKHFESRIRAQRVVLLASLGLDCHTPGLGARRRLALAEIRAILRSKEVSDAPRPASSDRPSGGDPAAGDGGDPDPAVPGDPAPPSGSPPAGGGDADPPGAGGGGGPDGGDPGGGGDPSPPVETPPAETPPDQGVIDQIAGGVQQIVGGAGEAVEGIGCGGLQVCP